MAIFDFDSLWLISSTVFLPALIYFIFQKVFSKKPQKSKKELLQRLESKQRERERHFDQVRQQLADPTGNLEQKRLRISALDFFHLQKELQKGTITASDAVDAFRWKSMQCQEKLNCVVDFLHEAVETALKMDREYANGAKEKPPLFGIPFSVKEGIHVKGYDCTAGLVKNLDRPLEEDNTLIAHLRTLGAIPIVRTNVVQTCMSFTCSNPIFGKTLNPHDPERTPGGSTGGDGCLVATGGVPFGTGSDIGGSVRIPAHFCGIKTIKPTSARPKVFGGHPGMPGVKVGLSYSFFTKDIAALTYLFELTLSPTYFSKHPQSVPIPFNASLVTQSRRLRIGFYDEDGWFPTTPACKRAVKEAREALISCGHELVPFKIPDPERAMTIAMKVMFPDNGSFFLEQLQNEKAEPLLGLSTIAFSMPLTLRWLLAKLIAPFDHKLALIMNAYVRNLDDIRIAHADVDDYIKDFIHYWKSLNIDAVVGTVLPFPALKHDGPGKFSNGIFGTLVYNLVDFPAGVVPVTKVKQEDLDALDSYPTREPGQKFLATFFDMLREDMKTSRDVPVGVQVITLPFQEELCLKVLSDIESKIE